MRKSPIRHKVHTYQKDNGTTVDNYIRGHSSPSAHLANPALSLQKPTFFATTTAEKTYNIPILMDKGNWTVNDVEYVSKSIFNDFLSAKDNKLSEELKRLMYLAYAKAQLHHQTEAAKVYKDYYDRMIISVPIEEEFKKVDHGDGFSYVSRFGAMTQKEKDVFMKSYNESKGSSPIDREQIAISTLEAYREQHGLNMDKHELKKLIAWNQGEPHPTEASYWISDEEIKEFNRTHSPAMQQALARRFKSEMKSQERARTKYDKDDKWKKELQHYIDDGDRPNMTFRIKDMDKLVNMMSQDEYIPEAVWEYRDAGEMARIVEEAHPEWYISGGAIERRSKSI